MPFLLDSPEAVDRARRDAAADPEAFWADIANKRVMASLDSPVAKALGPPTDVGSLAIMFQRETHPLELRCC